MRLLNRTLLVFCFCLVVCLVGCSKQPKPTRIVIYYMGWDIDTYIPQICDDLIQSGDSVEISNRSDIKTITDYLNDVELIKIQDDGDINARICCFFYDANGNTIRTITFGPPSSLAIDDSNYQWNISLFELFISYLPQEYKDRIYSVGNQLPRCKSRF